jgi:tripartite-type tricarboxylate transporter receptor subunit TctC
VAAPTSSAPRRSQGCARRPHADDGGSRHLRRQSGALRQDKLPFDIEKDFTPITGLNRIHHSLIASPSFAPKNFAEVLELARKKGEITYGTAGIGSGPHVNVVRLENEAKIKLNAIHAAARRQRKTTSWALTPT